MFSFLSRSVSLAGEKERKMLKEIVKRARNPVKSRIVPQGNVSNILSKKVLCWFQTSLPLCRVIIACCFRVAALSGNAALALSPSGIAPELNRIQLSAICCGGQMARLSIYWHEAACRLVIPLRQVVLAQLNKYHHQSGKQQVSLKPALVVANCCLV